MKATIPGAKVDNPRPRGEDVRTFLLEHVESHPNQVVARTAAHFGITRQAVHKHLRKLVAENAVLASGNTRDRSYRLAPLLDWKQSYKIGPELAEDQGWTRDVSPALGRLPQNVLDIWNFCFTEIFNNAIDHSGGAEITVRVVRTAANTHMLVRDDGVGIFRNIQRRLNLLDERHAVLELAKGKLTTDPENHTGQGIFFASRLVDSFDIVSGGVFFNHTFGGCDDWIQELPAATEGTAVFMKLSNRSSRTDRQVFEQYSSGEDYGFTKTVVPVRLAQYGEDKLVSRSQAKRLLARVDLFRTVLFDFAGVETIGQAFADEIFRVYARSHPQLELIPVNASPQIQQVVNSVRAHWAAEVGGV